MSHPQCEQVGLTLTVWFRSLHAESAHIAEMPSSTSDTHAEGTSPELHVYDERRAGVPVPGVPSCTTAFKLRGDSADNATCPSRQITVQSMSCRGNSDMQPLNSEAPCRAATEAPAAKRSKESSGRSGPSEHEKDHARKEEREAALKRAASVVEQADSAKVHSSANQRTDMQAELQGRGPDPSCTPRVPSILRESCSIEATMTDSAPAGRQRIVQPPRQQDSPARVKQGRGVREPALQPGLPRSLSSPAAKLAPPRKRARASGKQAKKVAESPLKGTRSLPVSAKGALYSGCFSFDDAGPDAEDCPVLQPGDLIRKQAADSPTGSPARRSAAKSPADSLTDSPVCWLGSKVIRSPTKRPLDRFQSTDTCHLQQCGQTGSADGDSREQTCTKPSHMGYSGSYDMDMSDADDEGVPSHATGPSSGLAQGTSSSLLPHAESQPAQPTQPQGFRAVSCLRERPHLEI